MELKIIVQYILDYSACKKTADWYSPVADLGEKEENNKENQIQI
jgi:hypothetical protein